MWDSQGEAGNLPPPRRNYDSVQLPEGRFYDIVTDMSRATSSKPLDRDGHLPSFPASRSYSDFESCHVLPRPRDYPPSASQTSGAPISKGRSGLPWSHSSPGVDEASPTRSHPEPLPMDGAVHEEQKPPRPRIPSMQTPPGEEDMPPKLIPYSVLERIAQNSARAQTCSHMYPDAWTKDASSHAPHYSSLGRSHEPVSYPPDQRYSRSRSEIFPASMASSERFHGNDDLVRYSLNQPRDARSWYRSEGLGSYRASPYPRHRISPTEYRWSSSFGEEEYTPKRYPSYGGSYGNPQRSGRTYPHSYPYAAASAPSVRSESPVHGVEMLTPYDRRPRNPAPTHGKNRRGDLIALPDDTKYEPYSRRATSPSDYPYPKHHEGNLANQPISSCSNRPTTQSKPVKGKAGDSSQAGESQPKRGGKLPKPITDMLKSWLLEHADHPYPTEEEKRQFCEYTGLDICQISNWVRA